MIYRDPIYALDQNQQKYRSVVEMMKKRKEKKKKNAKKKRLNRQKK